MKRFFVCDRSKNFANHTRYFVQDRKRRCVDNIIGGFESRMYARILAKTLNGVKAQETSLGKDAVWVFSPGDYIEMSGCCGNCGKHHYMRFKV